MYQGDNELP